MWRLLGFSNHIRLAGARGQTFKYIILHQTDGVTGRRAQQMVHNNEWYFIAVGTDADSPVICRFAHSQVKRLSFWSVASVSELDRRDHPEPNWSPQVIDKPIVVLGGGVAGLTVARILAGNDVRCVSYRARMKLGGHVRDWACMATTGACDAIVVPLQISQNTRWLRQNRHNDRMGSVVCASIRR